MIEDQKQFDTVVVYTDGGSRGNPGPAALGVAIYDDAGVLVSKHGEFLGEQTNNYAEYSALIYALEQAQKLGAKSVKAFLDSELVVRQLEGKYRVKHKGLIPLFEKVKQLANAFEKITYKHVRRENNKVADAMVNEALDRQA